MRKGLIFLFIFLVGLIALPIFVFSQEEESENMQEEVVSAEVEMLNQRIKEKQDKIKQIEKSIANYKNKIKSKRLEAISLSNQMSILDNRVAQVELDIEFTKEKLDVLNLEIEQLELSIYENKEVMDRQKIMIAELIRTLHQNKDRNFIEVLATYNSFSEFYNGLQYLETVEEGLGQSVYSLKVAKVQLDEKKDERETKKDSYLKLNDKLQEKKKDLEENVFNKETLLVQTKASERTFKTLVGNLRSQYEQIEGEIQGIEEQMRKKLEGGNKLENINTGGNFMLSWPVPSRYVTSYFHDPDYPYRHVFEHNAIDIRASQGTPLKAAAAGYVAKARRCYASTCYSYIMIIHSGGFTTVYGHPSSISVNVDQFVAKGDIIGYSGGTPGTNGAGPFVTGPHLHFELRKNGIPVNPLAYLPH
ncbi:MAG: peptidoglycan DD-metalloendopeptidase family protein [Candidatus Magasanikbacteria bacterium]|nr:peptidoglycan DD-metalloendopeptidase family protein [Candidatus Magasanikbacteria bacterium]